MYLRMPCVCIFSFIFYATFFFPLFKYTALDRPWFIVPVWFDGARMLFNVNHCRLVIHDWRHLKCWKLFLGQGRVGPEWSKILLLLYCGKPDTEFFLRFLCSSVRRCPFMMSNHIEIFSRFPIWKIDSKYFVAVRIFWVRLSQQKCLPCGASHFFTL